MIPNNFLLNRQQVKYSQTLIHHNPHLAPTKECKQKFPIMWYFNVLPLSTSCHPQYTTTNRDEQVVVLYCTILLLWWHIYALWLDGLKINHPQSQTMHVCNTKIKQKGHQFLLTFLLQYTTYIAAIFTYVPHYFNPTVLIYKVSVTKHQSAASFGTFVFKLPYICNNIKQHFSSCLSIWRDRVTSIKKGMVSQLQQKHIAFNP